MYFSHLYHNKSVKVINIDKAIYGKCNVDDRYMQGVCLIHAPETCIIHIRL